MSWGDIGSSKSRVELLLKDRVGLDNIEDRIGQDNIKDRTIKSVYSFQICNGTIIHCSTALEEWQYKVEAKYIHRMTMQCIQRFI